MYNNQIMKRNIIERFLATKTAMVLGIILLIFIGIELLGYRQSFLKIKLYYPNVVIAEKIGPNGSCDTNSISYVWRSIIHSDTPIQDTVRELIKGDIYINERKAGFTSEFPNNNFKLLGANFSSDGTLTLFFNEVPGFTSGGSCRVGMLSAQIEKTAKQFPQVKKVLFVPETIFQP